MTATSASSPTADGDSPISPSTGLPAMPLESLLSLREGGGGEDISGKGRWRGRWPRPSAGAEFLELAIAEKLVLSCFQQGVKRSLLTLAQRLGEGLFQGDHH